MPKDDKKTVLEKWLKKNRLVTLTMDQFFGLMLRMGSDFFSKFKQAAS